MAEHARSTFRAFQAVGVSPRLLDVADANRGFDPDLERDFAPHLVTTLGEGVNLFGVNGDEAARVIEKVDEAAFSRGYNIAYPAWELAQYPKAWAQVLDRFDEIWAPSAFVQQALEDAVSRPVHRMPLPVDLKLSSFWVAAISASQKRPSWRSSSSTSPLSPTARIPRPCWKPSSLSPAVARTP